MSCKINPTLAFLLLDTEPALLNSVRICIYIYQKSTIFCIHKQGSEILFKGDFRPRSLKPFITRVESCRLLPFTFQDKWGKKISASLVFLNHKDAKCFPFSTTARTSIFWHICATNQKEIFSYCQPKVTF